MGNDVEGSLEATGCIREDITVVSDAHGSDAHETEVEAEVGAVKREETGVYIHFKVSTSFNMSLAISFVFSNLPTQLPILLDVAFRVLVCVSAVQ